MTDDEDEFKGLMEYDIVIKEQDFEKNEKLSLGGDVYNYTICAFMTGCTSPIKKGYCLKQCFIVFSIQIIVPYFFLKSLGINNYQEPKAEANAIRLICSLLLHMKIFDEVKQSISVMRYLKYTKSAKDGKRGRFVNFMLCTMQFISPNVTECILIIAIGQVKNLSDIIKSFVALAFVIKIDDWFSENFPPEIKECAKNLKLVIGEDQNSLKKIT